VEDAVDIWHYAILELHARNDDDDFLTAKLQVLQIFTNLIMPQQLVIPPRLVE